MVPGSLVVEADEDRVGVEDVADPLADGSTIASNSSWRASAAPISLTSASSSLRWRVSSMARARASAVAMCWATNVRRSRSHRRIGAGPRRSSGPPRGPIVRPSARSGRSYPVGAGDAEKCRVPSLDDLLVLLAAQEHRLARSQEVTGQAGGLAGADRLPHSRIRDVEIDLVAIEREVDHLAPVVVEGYVEVVRVHELADDLVDRLVERGHVARCSGRFGDAVEDGLDPLGGLRTREPGLQVGDPLQ